MSFIEQIKWTIEGRLQEALIEMSLFVILILLMFGISLLVYNWQKLRELTKGEYIMPMVCPQCHSVIFLEGRDEVFFYCGRCNLRITAIYAINGGKKYDRKIPAEVKPLSQPTPRVLPTYGHANGQEGFNGDREILRAENL